MPRNSLVCWTALVVITTAACDVDDVVFRAPAMRTVTAGAAHSCSLSTDGAAYCWGEGSAGQLGTGSNGSKQYATRVVTNNTFTEIDAGGEHTCALAADGRAFCWGANESGQLGAGDRQPRTAPQLVQTTERFAEISAGWEHTCAVTTDGRALCWGNAANDRLGSNIPDDATSPALVETSLRFSQISAGGRHTCAIAVDGTAHCWGANELAQLGNGVNGDPQPPGRVLADFVFSGISAGFNHSCGVAPNRVAYCWGENAFGESGSGWKWALGSPGQHYPVPVSSYGEIMWVHISAGKHFACGTRDQGQAYCWGKGDFGQLGEGNFEDDILPQWVRPGPGRIVLPDVFVKVEAGDNHACGLGNNGVIFCWGDGGVGQLGNGERLSPTPLPVLSIR